MTRFTGFADGNGRFFKALAKNNEKSWFEAHKAEFEDGWNAPMKVLLAEVKQAIDRDYGRCDLAARRRTCPWPANFHVGATEIFGAAGHYMMKPDALERFRAAVADPARGKTVPRALPGSSKLTKWLADASKTAAPLVEWLALAIA